MSAEAQGARGGGAERIAAAFAVAREQDRAALIGYLPAGFPSAEGCVRAVTAMVGAGVDLIEIGLPYSDPLMDGPTIQAAVDRALSAGTGTRQVLDTVAAVAGLGVPVLVMTYWNPVARYGAERFAADLATAGGSGVITPDLTPEEGGGWLSACAGAGLAPVLLVAPSSTDARIGLISGHCRGFVYAASTMGVTGARAEVSAAAPDLVRRVREVTDLPVAVGLGVSNGAQAAEVASYANGVIVGSAFVRVLLEASDEDAGITAVAALSAELAVGVGGARGR